MRELVSKQLLEELKKVDRETKILNPRLCRSPNMLAKLIKFNLVKQHSKPLPLGRVHVTYILTDLGEEILNSLDGESEMQLAKGVARAIRHVR